MSAYAEVEAPAFHSVEEFLAWVDPQPERWELVAGSPVSLAAGNARQFDLQINLLTALRVRARRKAWRPHGSDLLIRIDDRTGRFPDASITAGPRSSDQAADPLVVFEILADEDVPRSGAIRRAEYQKLASLRHYVSVARDSVRLVCHSRSARGWQRRMVTGIDASLSLPVMELDLPLAELYRGVEHDLAA